MNNCTQSEAEITQSIIPKTIYMFRLNHICVHLPHIKGSTCEHTQGSQQPSTATRSLRSIRWFHTCRQRAWRRPLEQGQLVVPICFIYLYCELFRCCTWTLPGPHERIRLVLTHCTGAWVKLTYPASWRHESSLGSLHVNLCPVMGKARPQRCTLYSWFKTFAVFCMLYAFFWVIPRRLNFICRRFGTLCLFHLHRRISMKND